jgi:hypothetical protein
MIDSCGCGELCFVSMHSGRAVYYRCMNADVRFPEERWQILSLQQTALPNCISGSGPFFENSRDSLSFSTPAC